MYSVRLLLIITTKSLAKALNKTALQHDILTLPNSMFLIDEAETLKLREDFKVLVGRILVERIPSLSLLKSIVTTHIESKYPKEMAQQSTITPLAMQV